MSAWRGAITQWLFGAFVVVLAWHTAYVEHAMFLLGAILGANVTRAKVDAAYGSALTAALWSAPPVSGSIPPASLPPNHPGAASMNPPPKAPRVPTGVSITGALTIAVLAFLIGALSGAVSCTPPSPPSPAHIHDLSDCRRTSESYRDAGPDAEWAAYEDCKLRAREKERAR